MSKFRAKKLAYKKKKKSENKYNLTENQERIFLEKTINTFIGYKKTPDGGSFLAGDSCVSHSQLFHLFLKKLKYKSELICVDVSTWNTDYVEWNNSENQTYEETSDGYVCEGFPNAYIGLCGHMDNWDFQNDLDGYSGHVIVETKHHVIDLTSGQFSRPDKDINVPPIIIMPKTMFGTRKEREDTIPPMMQQLNDTSEKARCWKDSKTKRELEKENHAWSGLKTNSRIAFLPFNKHIEESYSGSLLIVTRPDQKISENYPRWNKKSFSITNDRLAEVLMLIHKGENLDMEDRIKVYEDSGHLTVDVSEDE